MPVKKQPRVVFLESQEGVESLFTRGLRNGAAAAGWQTELVFLADADGHARTEKEVRYDLLEKQADTICFLMDAPLDLKNIWDAPSLKPVDKISLWFDDYYRSPKTLARPETWTDWQLNHGVRVGMWDGYWRCQWKNLTGIEPFPIHLAADPKLLSPNAEPWNPAWSERAAFVGTIPSLKSLNSFGSAFPAPLRRHLEEICDTMQHASWPIRPYDLAHSCRSFLGVKYRSAVDAMLKEPSTQALWNHLLWRWGKRIARLRGLAAAAKAGPIAIMSGHGTESYAGEDELRAVLPTGTDLVYADTCGFPAQSWKGLFRTGKFQLQITDPQSMSGGLPFRVFECAACAVPLLSDSRQELADLFPPESGLVIAPNEASFEEEAGRLFATPKAVLEQKGQQMHQAFLKQHTWEIRWRGLVQGREYCARSQAFPSITSAKLPMVKPLVPQAA